MFHAVQIFITHGHFDHCLASNVLLRQLKPRPALYLHAKDKFLFENLANQVKMVGLKTAEDQFPGVEDIHSWLKGGEDITLAGRKVGTVLHTPGHSPGSV
ncbi:hypothetical protein HK101_009685, partial [Irineochytrium annulatum]